MNAGLIARRYATVLYDYADEQGQLTQMYDDAKTVCDTLAGQDVALALLNSPLRKASDKKAFIEKLFSKYVSAPMLKFMLFVIDKRRTELMCEVLRVFRVIYKQKLGIKSARITTAKPVSAANQNAFAKIIEAKAGGKVEMDFEVDETIIGGIIVAIDGKQLDCSITRQLKEIEKGLTA